MQIKNINVYKVPKRAGYRSKKSSSPDIFNVWITASLAQKEGFEPSRALYTPTPLAGEPLRPLGYFCKPNAGIYYHRSHALSSDFALYKTLLLCYHYC